MTDAAPEPNADYASRPPREAPIQGGALRIFRLLGVSVFVHWSWLVIAGVEVVARKDAYRMQIWNIAEYLALFLMVLLHEFGHALACRSIGGSAERILLWPLGGVAYVSPPLRPGALLWSIAAGPLVNVALLPITLGALLLGSWWLGGRETDAGHFIFFVFAVNLLLLAFNLLPIYPLDGGQMLRALLWFVIGPARSLTAVAVIGLIGAAGFALLALSWQNMWLVVIAVYAGWRSLAGIADARALAALLSAPRYADWRCARCHAPPPIGDYWLCKCGGRFDTFAHGAVCPRCASPHAVAHCPFCGQPSALSAWQTVPVPAPIAPPTRPAALPAPDQQR